MLNLQGLFSKIAGRLHMLKTRHLRPKGTICYGDGSNLVIGRGVSFGGNVVLFGTDTITIGDHTMIALNTIIHTSTHDYNDHPMWRKRIDKPVRIGEHVWIGAGAIILPGVIIGDHAVVGSGSVVTANVPPGAIVVGNPARIVKHRDPSVYGRPMSIGVREENEIMKGGFLDKSCK